MKEMSKEMGFGKSVFDNGWGMFVSFLKYKLEEQGKRLTDTQKSIAEKTSTSIKAYEYITPIFLFI